MKSWLYITLATSVHAGNQSNSYNLAMSKKLSVKINQIRYVSIFSFKCVLFQFLTLVRTRLCFPCEASLATCLFAARSRFFEYSGKLFSKTSSDQPQPHLGLVVNRGWCGCVTDYSFFLNCLEALVQTEVILSKLFTPSVKQNLVQN